jgi:prepilin-type N-terminal cleavage/methylation domain-containing protein
MQKTKGFTLIELLVVIAIIGILSGLIIVSMSGAQNAAKDARIKSAMDQFRSTAEVYKLNAGDYGSTLALSACTATATSLIVASSDGKALCDDMQSQGTGTLALYATSTAYCIQKVLPGGSTWCLDSSGAVGCIGSTGCTTSIGDGCDIDNYKCL